MARAAHPAGALARLGFSDTRRTERLLTDAALADIAGAAEDSGASVPEALSRTADPDDALLALVRLAERWRDERPPEVDLPALLSDDTDHRRRLLALLGGSRAMADMLVARPGDVALLGENASLEHGSGRERGDALRAVGADPASAAPVATIDGTDGVDALRRHYRRRLLQVAAVDLTSEDPPGIMPQIGATLADLAGAAVEAALAVARADCPEAAAVARLAIIGMGKTGGRELNYVSDVDVIYVAAPAGDADEQAALSGATKLATKVLKAISGVAGEPPLWPLDANLRPEGADGPLVRTVASHVAYYERWAHTWEFQALLKARHLAGDAALGREYVEATRPFVWTAVTRENFVEDTRAMRRRVEDHIRPAEAERQLKLGRGGLRDVEFTVQLLQLVHGRTDESLRSPATVDALAALARGGYVGRQHAKRLDECYRFLRVLEHRIQLSRLRRTHLVPTQAAELRRLGRALGRFDGEPGEWVDERFRAVRREVRALHEEIYYRPLLPVTARLAADEVRLAPDAVRSRLSAIGYRDPDGAVRHLERLTSGMSRTAAIQRHIMPVVLDWLADGPDPDAGLLAFRTLSENLGGAPWYLSLLRDSGVAAPRLARVLSFSRYAAEGLELWPEGVAWLGQDKTLRPPTSDQLRSEAASVLARRRDTSSAIAAVRHLRRRELTRAAIGDVLDGVNGDRQREVVTPAAEMAVSGALDIARAVVAARRAAGRPVARRDGAEDDRLPEGWIREGELSSAMASSCRFLIVAMGRMGGAEMSYVSDADVLFVYEPLAGADSGAAREDAGAIAAEVRSLLSDPGSGLALPIDSSLRPEGRHGPIVRSFDSYAEYYARWAEPWERQALLRARPVAGDPDLAERFVALIDPLRYPAGGLEDRAARELRRIKARVESERMPRGVPASRHLKLGRGGLSDVEWTVQLLQLQHAGQEPGLRTQRTLEGLEAAGQAGLLEDEQVEVLAAAWRTASRIRDAVALFTGRATMQKADVLPHEGRALAGVARLLGYEPGQAHQFEDDYLRVARRARSVVERVFFG